MTSVADSVIFRTIFSTPESAQIWNDKRRTQYYLNFEAALARAQARLEIIPKHAAQAISERCSLELIDWVKLEEQTKLIGYPVLPVVKQLVTSVNEIEDGLGEWAHWGATTQDVTDTATVLQLRDTMELVSASLDQITSSLRVLCAKYRSTPMAGRSNLQQAVPISFGFKLARLLATFERHRTRLAELLPRLLVLDFSGAAGTLATLSPSGESDIALRCQHEVAVELGLGVPEIAWHTERDRIAECGGFFALVTGTCAKFATDLKLLMQNEVGEASEPYVPHRGSSSTMPQKRNPISSVYITAMASTVRQLSAALYDAMVEDHERSTGPWEIEWIVLPQICTLAHACLIQTRDVLDGLEVHEDAMRRNLDLTRGAICSEAVMMGLGPFLGRQVAHDLVYDLCHRSATEGRPLYELLLEDQKVYVNHRLSAEQLQKLCDPGRYLGSSERMVDRVLNGGKLVASI
ncbi:L-Aspartase-like protein [Punctularia strigosozonata HHB-11173 SS5]|uniref:L-Aspartase-like protein n=1 Tax=Punctularia strigosozonata (strain HHB-11173) TaxID=741275 RepID=UPI0004417E7A|nr:L-Aspartase-like protein [Punctularia strigosozonata HHB-11173 SS5]EIN12691.1 L-Aspartase-like protein [Punctularia strigosozonata HHB-11173 SS5]